MGYRRPDSEVQGVYDGITAAILMVARDIRRWWRERKEQHGNTD